jgi:hypothetical protein
MNFHPVEIAQTASSGAWSFNTLAISGGICKQILVKATTATTTFEFTITDDKDNVVYDTTHEETTATGTLNERIDLPMRGKYTLAVASSSADEAYTGRLLIAD